MPHIDRSINRRERMKFDRSVSFRPTSFTLLVIKIHTYIGQFFLESEIEIVASAEITFFFNEFYYCVINNVCSVHQPCQNPVYTVADLNLYNPSIYLHPAIEDRGPFTFLQTGLFVWLPTDSCSAGG